MGRYLFVLIPLFAVVIGGWLVTSAMERRAESERGTKTKAAGTREIAAYRSPLPVVPPVVVATVKPKPPEGARDPFALRPVPGPGSAEPVERARAERNASRLEALLESPDSTNEELLAALDAVAHAIHNPVEAEEPSDGTRRVAAALRKRGVQLLLTALALRDVHEASNLNLRDPVCLWAARLLRSIEEPYLPAALRRVLEKTFFKATCHVPEQILEEVFCALAMQNDMDSLRWMIEKFTHSVTKPSREVACVVAAHRALVLFRDVPGPLRHTLVREMQKTYAAVESRVARGDTADPEDRSLGWFWQRVGPGAMRAVRHFAGHPTGSEGAPLATMSDLVEWFRSHKNADRAPWTDE